MFAIDISFVKGSMVAVMAAGLMIVVVVTLVAIASKRPGLAAALGGILLLMIGLGGAVLVPALTYSGRHFNPEEVNVESSMSIGPHSMELHNGAGASVNTVRGNISGVGILFLLAIPIALLVAVASLWKSPKPAGQCGSRWAWVPVLLLIPLGALLLFGTARFRTSRHHHVETAHRQAVSMQQMSQHQVELARRHAEMTADVQKQIASMNIHDLMDKVDAPRIAIPPDAPAPPAAPNDGSVGDAASTDGDAKAVDNNATQAPAAVDDQSEQHTDSNDAEESKPDTKVSDDEEINQANDSRDKDEGNDANKDKPALDPPASVDAKEPASVKEPAKSTREAELSVAPPERPSKPAAPRPPWVAVPPKRIGEVQQEVIATDEWATEAECEQARDVALMIRTYEHIQAMLGVPYQVDPLDHTWVTDNPWGDNRLRELASAGITVDYVRREIAEEEYLETLDRSFGPMKKLYTLVAFSPAVDRQLRTHWEAWQRQERFAAVGAGGSILGLIGLAYGLLKVDTMTKGYYTKRLFIGVPAALIGGFGLLVAFMEMIDG